MSQGYIKANATHTGHLRHLSTAATHAAMRADAMLEAGDLDGLVVWKRILRAIDEMGNITPGADQTMN